MALRVLLGDESSTIKKVFQLALQDYAVDVCSVSVGLDVISVTQQFKPDIIFCDVLLQKKSGYDVCAELKADSELHKIPVILMWSGFMELDEDKLNAAKADGRLEKPFNVEDLRRLINQFVPKTQSQRLGSFLSFPKMPDMLEAQKAKVSIDPSGGVSPEPPTPPEPPQAEESWDMESFEEVPLPTPPQVDVLASDEDDQDEIEETAWSAKPLGKFRLDPEIAQKDEPQVKIQESEPEAELELEIESAAPPPPVPASEKSSPQTALSEEKLAEIIRAQSREMIEAVVWKVVPDLATQIIERELKRLLAEKEKDGTR